MRQIRGLELAANPLTLISDLKDNVVNGIRGEFTNKLLRIKNANQ